MKKRRVSLLVKILLSVGIPLAVIYCVVAAFTLNTVNKTVDDLTTQELTARSEAIANQIGSDFSSYMEIADQMAANSQFEQLFLNTVPGVDIAAAPGFSEVNKTMASVQATDPENIMAAWIVDIDTSKLAQSDGYFSGAGWNAKERPWYSLIVEKQGVVLTNPYEDTSTKMLIVSAVAPVYKPGTSEIIGATGIDFHLDNIAGIVKDAKVGKTGDCILVSSNGQLVYHPDKSLNNVNVVDADMSENIKNALLEKKTGFLTFDNLGQKDHGYVSTVADTGWTVATALPDKEFKSTYNKIQATVISIFLLAFMIILAVLFIMTRRVVAPMKKIAAAANKLAVGDVDVDQDLSGINATAREVDELTDAFGRVVDNVRDMSIAATRIEAGDLDLEVIPKSEKDVLAVSIASVIQTLKSLVDETNMLSEAMVLGKVRARGDVSKFKGEYAKVIFGINDTLTAITEPVYEALKVLRQMSNGNLHVTMNGSYQGDHEEIKKALNETIGNLLSYVSEISSVLHEVGNGNLDLAITADYRGDFIEIKNSLNHIIGSLNGVLGDIHEASDQVASGSRQVSDGSQALSQGSTEQASSIQELTASISEIAGQTKETAVKAGEVYELANGAKEAGSKGNDQMRDMLNSMEEINQASSNIQKIIKVIDDIAFQTNILALNAAVEAARAGQHGKGFAVVAEEVRSLAARSAEAARETADLIEGSISKVQTGTKIANETAKSLKDIADGAVLSTAKISEIAAASNEQATAIAQVNKGIEQIAQVVQSNSATAEQSAAASEELSSQAELLKEMVGRFKLNNKAGENNVKELQKDVDKETKNFKLLTPSFGAAAEPQIILDNFESDKY